MKILLPFVNHLNQEINHNIFGSGIGKFCHQIYHTFDDVEVVQIDNADVRNFKKIAPYLKSKALELDVDIIISNYDQAAFCGSKIIDSSIPILMIGHSNTGVASIIARLTNLLKKGHSVFLVSKFQKKYFDAMSKRLTGKYIQFDGFLNSSYCQGDKPKLVEPEYEVGTIGRCDSVFKKHFILKELLEDTNVKNLVMSNVENDTDPYYLKHKNQPDTFWNLPHSQVMDNLAKCKTYFGTYWHETWSITALEALSHGVPIILNAKDNNHAANVIPAKSSHYKNISHNSKKELISAISSFDGIDRKEIQDMTWEKHSHKNWKKTFSNAIDKTIEKFKKTRPTLEKFYD